MQVGSIKNIVKEIEKNNKIVIFHHIRPDGDCLGSQFGLKELILDNFPEKEVFAIGDSKNSFNFLDFKHDEIPGEDFLKESLAIIVDANFKERIECRELLDKNLFKSIIRIDHHPNDDDLTANEIWVDSSYIAAAEQIAHIAVENNWKISSKAASYIYLGILTDSGKFSYKNTSARTFYLTSKLMESDLDLDYINLSLSKNSIKDLEFISYVYGNFKTYKDVIYLSIPKEDQKKFNKTSNECCRPNLIANIENYRIWVFFLEEDNGKWRTEFRSNGPIVRNVAIKWNGGGHERASGAIIDNPSYFDAVIKDCQEEVENWTFNK